MEQQSSGLLDQAVQFSSNSAGKIKVTEIGYRMLSSIVGDLKVSSASSSTFSLDSSDDYNTDGLGNNNNTKAASASILTTNWFWNSSAPPSPPPTSSSSPKQQQQYSSKGLDKEFGLPLFTLQDVSLHDMPHDCWVVLYDRVYDITCFLNSHPGGDEVMLEYAGLDATLAFRGVGHTKEAEESLKPYLIGILVENERIWTRFFNMKSDVP